MSRSFVRRADQQGFVTIEFAAGCAFLLLPITLLVLTLPTWFERVDMTRIAAREAARDYVINNNQAESQQIVNDIQNNYKIPQNDMTLSLSGDPTQRGGKVTATVTTKVPATHIPIINVDGPAFTIKSTHVEPVDEYRSE